MESRRSSGRRAAPPLWAPVALALSVFASACASHPPPPAAESPAQPWSRTEALKIIADMRRIVTPRGIERLEPVRIGGIDQWVSIRGTDRSNPVLLMLHGGPGYPAMPTSWYFQRGWEEYFTVVQWDQRGSGKTYAANDAAQGKAMLTQERMIADAEELIGWLRTELGKTRVFLLGHSWGSFLGLSIAQRHPEWLHAYIGMGQLTIGYESERRGFRFAMQRAQQTKNEAALRELQAIAPYAIGDKPIPIKNLYVQRKWLGFFGGAVSGRTDTSTEAAAVALSPEYTDADLRKIWDGNELSEGALLGGILQTDLHSITELGCPLILLEGRDDYNVSSSLAAEWFERVQAPSKTLVWFEHTGHEVMNEAPGKTLVSLVKYALPIAEKAGDPAP
jgi:pimeloyl-ACP methyl ester carboxylesterase